MSFFVRPTCPSPLTAENAAATPAPTAAASTFIDILYDHAGYLAAHDDTLAAPGSMAGKRVAIIGSGPAGLLAAAQLMQLGAEVDILEAHPHRAGGRINTHTPIPGDAARFELGAMRVPPCEQLFNLYAKRFGMTPAPFPDPGHVDTAIVFQNQRYEWPAGGSAPELFKTVTQAWDSFAGGLTSLANRLVPGPDLDYAAARQAWQALIAPSTAAGPEQGYSNISFYQGLVQAFVEDYQRYGLTQPWGEEEFALFGAIGLGGGGFGPLYPVNFAEIVRLVVNGLETDQKFYGGGIGALVDGFLALDFGGGTVGSRIRYGSAVSSVTGGPPAQIRVAGGAPESFDAVIVATTTRAMQVDMGMTQGTAPAPPADAACDAASTPGLPLDADATTGIRKLHLMNSSKLFVLTKTKFWDQHQGLPANVQTDGLVRGLYCLDYPGTDHGVVLISYTWGDDSTKCIAVKDPTARLELLLDSLEPQLPEFVAALRDGVLPEHTTLIDWQDQPHFYGAFKLNYPGQDPYNQSLYYQFARSTNGVYLAGSAISWSGGWIEGALQTGMNAAAAVVEQCAPRTLFDGSPMTQRDQATQYKYA